MRHLAVGMVWLLVACGGTQTTKTDDTEDGPDKDKLCTGAMTAAVDANEAAWNDILAKGEPKTLEDLAAAACQRYCGRATECAIQDACDQLDAAGVADLNLDKTAPENTEQCLAACNGARMTKQQITTMGNCAQDESTCAAFRGCAGGEAPR